MAELRKSIVCKSLLDYRPSSYFKFWAMSTGLKTVSRVSSHWGSDFSENVQFLGGPQLQKTVTNFVTVHKTVVYAADNK
jgi:hypothetical protein